MKPIEGYNKLRGGYYTPDKISEFIAEWAIRKTSDSVLEPSCGDGSFLSAITYRAFIYQRIYQYCRKKHEKIREDLRRYPGNTETGKCRKNLQYWAFEKKYQAKMEL